MKKAFQNVLLPVSNIFYLGFKRNKTQIIILLITLIPTLLLILSTFLSLQYLQITNLRMIDDFAEELYRDQIKISKLQNRALVFQLNQQVQKIAWQINMLNEFLGKVINGDVVKNKKHHPAIHNIDRSYLNDEDMNVLKLFWKNPVYTSVWQFQYAFQRHMHKLVIFLIAFLFAYNGIRMDSIWKAIKFDNKIKQERKLMIKDIFMAHEYDGMIYMTSINTTYATYPIPKGCQYTGKYRLDLRCRYYYPPTMKDISTKLYEPAIFYTEGNPHLASPFCLRRIKYNSQDPSLEGEKYSIICITLDLSIIPNYFKNFGQNSKFQLFLDPRKLSVVYHSEMPLQRATVATVQDFETQYMTDQNEAQKFLDNISSMSQYILLSTDQLDNQGEEIQYTQKQFEYQRNGTDCFVIENLITMIDKVPRYETTKKDNPSKKFQLKGAFLFLDVLSKEKMTQYSTDLKQQIINYNKLFTYPSWAIIFFILLFEIYYSIKLARFLLHPIIHLTKILSQIRIQNQKQNDQNSQTRKQNNSYSEQPYSTQRNTVFSEVMTEQDNQIQIDEHLDADFEGVCFSSDTQILLDSFQNLFKILRFTTQNFYKENESISLLNLNIQKQHFESFGNYRALGVCHNNMGVLHYNQGRYSEALENFQKAVIYARYELNQYSHETDEGTFLTNNIQRCTIQLRSTLFRKENSFDSQNGIGTTIQELSKKKSNFNNQQQTTHQNISVENQQLYWNLYNRNQNFIKAFNSYLSKQDPQNSHLWDIFEDLALENMSISQLFLPESNKREMTNYYIILLGYFNQNLNCEANNILNKFSELYIRNYEIKNNISKNILNHGTTASLSQINGNFSYQYFKQSPRASFQIQESQLGLSQLNNMNVSSNTNETILLMPLQKVKSKQKKKLTFQGFKNPQNPTLDDKTTFLKKKFQNIQKNQLQINSDGDLNLQESPVSSQQFTIQKMGILYEVQNSNSSRKTPRNSIENQNTNFEQNNIVNNIIINIEKIKEKQQDQQINKPKNNGEIFSDILKKYRNSCQSRSSNNEQNQTNKLIQDFKSRNSKLNSMQVLDIISNQNPSPKQSGVQSKQKLDESKKQNLSPSQQVFNSRNTISKQTNNKLDIQNNLDIKKNNNDTSLISFASTNRLTLNGQESFGIKQSKQESKRLSQNKNQIIQTREQKNSSSSNQNYKILISDFQKSQPKVNQRGNNQIRRRKESRQNQVRKIEKQEKLSRYEFSSDIIFYYYALQQAQYQIQNKNYRNAAELLTNVLEQCEYYLPHLKIQSLNKLNYIFQQSQIVSHELEEIKNKYEQNAFCQLQTCVISSCYNQISQKRVYSFCTDLLEEVLFRDTDQFGVIKYSFKEGIYLQQMGLTQVKIINSCSHFFHDILQSLYSDISSVKQQSPNNFKLLNQLAIEKSNKSIKQVRKKSSQSQQINHKKEIVCQVFNTENVDIQSQNQYNEKLNPIFQDTQYFPYNLIQLQSADNQLSQSLKQQVNNQESIETYNQFESIFESDELEYNKNTIQFKEQNNIINGKINEQTLKNQNNKNTEVKTLNTSNYPKDAKLKHQFSNLSNSETIQTPSSLIPSYLFSKSVYSMKDSFDNKLFANQLTKANTKEDNENQNQKSISVNKDKSSTQLKSDIKNIKATDLQNSFSKQDNSNTNQKQDNNFEDQFNSFSQQQYQNDEIIMTTNYKQDTTPRILLNQNQQSFNYLHQKDNSYLNKDYEEINLSPDASYQILNSRKTLQNNQPEGDLHSYENFMDSSIINFQSSHSPIISEKKLKQLNNCDTSFTQKQLTREESFFSNKQSQKEDYKSQGLINNQNFCSSVSFSFLRKDENQFVNSQKEQSFQNNSSSLHNLSQLKILNNNNFSHEEDKNQHSNFIDDSSKNHKMNQQNYFLYQHSKNQQSVPQSPMFYVQTSTEPNILISQLQLNDPLALQKTISSPVQTNTKAIDEPIIKKAKKVKKSSINGEQVFHQGIQAALKYFILNSDNKISCYLSKRNVSVKTNFIDSNKNNQTFIIYITDQKLQLRNQLFINQLSQLLWNLDLELLVLVLNQKHSLEEFSSFKNVFFNKKQIISFFQTEKKLLQYIYNQREHVSNSLIPMIVEHF